MAASVASTAASWRHRLFVCVQSVKSMSHAECMSRLWRRVTALVVLVAGVLAAIPGAAAAHGPVAPVASSYLARVDALPAGLDAKVIDGDQRIWLRAPSRETVIVLDYRGAPYLRSRTPVWRSTTTRRCTTSTRRRSRRRPHPI